MVISRKFLDRRLINNPLKVSTFQQIWLFLDNMDAAMMGVN